MDRDLIERALRGDTLNAGDGYQLMQAPTEMVLEAAGQLRDRLKGHHLTYSRKVFLPVTNLCRDRCSYCTFRKSAKDPKALTMDPPMIRQWSRAAEKQGCKEALMCLGDRPESVYPEYRELLAQFGVGSTAEYLVRACEIALEEGLLPHTNAGLLRRDEMKMLRPLNVSMGLMLETVSPRLRQQGLAHSAAPDKDPELRLQMIAEAGELKIPFTSGILIGIGETHEERVDSLLALRELHRRFGHIQEVIVQPFRAKEGTRMADFQELPDREIAHTVAVARLLLQNMNLQAPPNLSPQGHRLLIRAGINDWGGISPVTKDFINPEAPWPHLDALGQTCRQAGYSFGERLALYPEYLDREEFLDSRLRPAVQRFSERVA